MTISRLLIANRGEIAIRVVRAAAELGIPTVAVYSADDAESLHVRMADEALRIPGNGVAAYLDGEAMVTAALEAGADAIHPGYGFLSENAGFARLCAASGVRFVGPRLEILELFGDKTRARDAAEAAGVPVLAGTRGATPFEAVRAFFENGGEHPVIIKAVLGGGGRGVRVVREAAELHDAFVRCQAEARTAFGDGALYVERLVERARHIEVQVLGDGSGAVAHLGERDCSIQRRHQKIVEVAPAPGLPRALRDRITAAAVRLAESVHYDNVGTMEFLVDAPADRDEASFAFIEANPRLQVEHTVTEAVTGVDIVRAQLELAAGRSLSELGLAEVPAPRGFAVQVRVNMETMTAEGTPMPSGGTLAAFDPPSGPGVRVDTFGYAGYRTNPRFDSLLAKVITHSPTPRFEDAVGKAYRSLCEFRIEGVPTNAGFLQSILLDRRVRAGDLWTRFVDEQISDLIAGAHAEHPQLYVPPSNGPAPAAPPPAARA